MQLAYPCKLERDNDGRYVVSFPDLPEVLTDGATKQEALSEAVDCLNTALTHWAEDRLEEIPEPSRKAKGQVLIEPDPEVALKVALNRAKRECAITAAELARRMNVDHKEARRILDLKHRTKFGRMVEALRAFGYQVGVSVR